MSANPPPDYEEIERGLWHDNAADVVPRLNERDRDLLKRIKTYYDRFGYPCSNIVKKIREDKMFAATFAKEPRRTGYHEKVAAEWLAAEMGVKVERLPSGGKDALYVTSDGVITRWQASQGKPPSKSLDFRWLMNGMTFYAMHKYTKESGGNQDSQYNEMIDLLRNFQKAQTPQCPLIVIVDGPYYTESRMNRLRGYIRTNPPQSFATSIEDVPKIAANIGG